MRKSQVSKNIKYTQSPLLFDHREKVKVEEPFNFRYSNPKQDLDYMDQALKKLEKNFLADFHVVENA
jgi:hypothetical protein